jgi:hypothetical protein
VNPKTGVEFRGKKGNLYEGGLRIPMIVRWPGRISPRRVSDLLCYFPDVLPTLTELAGVDPPKDIDGISIVPELLGQEVAGRKQAQHEYLYWELGRQAAVRMGHWKAVRPRAERPWELYDLSRDLSESSDVAAQHPEILAKMKAFAKEAHTPARAGVFQDRSIHEKDRRAKWGGRAPQQQKRGRANRGKVNKLPQEGLIPNASYKIARVSSESKSNGKLAQNSIDGDPRTHWHTRFGSDQAKPPHELVIDLSGEHTIRGFRYLARQDAGWNGTVAQCEFYVSSDGKEFGKPVCRITFPKTKEPQEVKWSPLKGRYVLLRIVSEVNGGPWASAAELGVVGD